ncbi:MAG: DUF11 domain-containing protein, partial [Gammaproteobacteria bacterium]|nr:DUF11 domain-containing protein [Gammaproteobacteria bacterium]
MKVLSKLFGYLSDRGFSACRTQVTLLLAALLLLTAPLSQAVIIDSFDTAQPPVVLQAPGDLGVTQGSTQAAAEALGGNRNYRLTLTGGTLGTQARAFVGGGLYNHVQDPQATARSLLVYDGSNDPLTTNTNGLGGADLTDAGTSNAVEVRVVFADQGAVLRMVVHSGPNNRSQHELAVTTTATEQIFIVPFTDFTTAAGAAGPADFSNVGAVTVEVDGTLTAALDVQLDLLQTRATLVAEKAAALLVDNNGNGLVDAGDQIEYNVVVQNISSAPLNNVVFDDFVDVNSTLDCTAPGDPTTTQGTITLCDSLTGQLSADIGVLDIGPLNAVTISFRVDVNDPIPSGTEEICNQGFFNGDTFTNIPTDDPATFDLPDDPTCLPVTSTIIIEKLTVPAGSAQSFDFFGDLNAGAPFALTDTQTFTQQTAPGQYLVVEGAVAGWSLTNLVCTDPNGNSVVDIGARTATISLEGGETVRCTFTNTQQGTIIVEKQTNPDGSPQSFDFSGDAAGSIIDGQQIIVNGLLPGNYSSTETLPAGWTLTSISCDDGNSSGNVNTATANFVLDAGETVTCTFLNSQEGSITIVKNTQGSDGTFTFTSSTLTPSPFNITTIGNTGSQVFSPLPPGLYDVAETVPAGWDLIDATCSDGSPVNAIDLNGGENVTCTFTNRQRGAL